MAVQGGTQKGSHRLVTLLVPWVFLVVFAVIFLNFLWPRMLGGSVLAIIFGTFVMFIFATFSVAAVTFSRDVLNGKLRV